MQLSVELGENKKTQVCRRVLAAKEIFKGEHITRGAGHELLGRGGGESLSDHTLVGDFDFTLGVDLENGDLVSDRQGRMWTFDRNLGRLAVKILGQIYNKKYKNN